MAGICLGQLKVVRVNQKSVVFNWGKEENIFATHKVANKILKAKLNFDEKLDVFIVEKQDIRGNNVKWLAMLSIFG